MKIKSIIPVAFIFVFTVVCASTATTVSPEVKDAFLTNLGLEGKEKVLLEGTWHKPGVRQRYGYFVLTDEAIYMFMPPPERGISLSLWRRKFNPGEDLKPKRLVRVLSYVDLVWVETKLYMVGRETVVRHKSEGDLYLGQWVIGHPKLGLAIGDAKKVRELIREQILRHATGPVGHDFLTNKEIIEVYSGGTWTGIEEGDRYWETYRPHKSIDKALAGKKAKVKGKYRDKPYSGRWWVEHNMLCVDYSGWDEIDDCWRMKRISDTEVHVYSQKNPGEIFTETRTDN